MLSEPLPDTTLAAHGRITPQHATRWGRDIADGLAAVHAAGGLHRDLHAGVVGLAEDGTTVVGGVATTVVTRDGLRDGIPMHVPPEVARGAAPSPASDVFALGVLLSHAVRGHQPPPGIGDPPPGTAAAPGVANLDWLLPRCRIRTRAGGRPRPPSGICSHQATHRHWAPGPAPWPGAPGDEC